MPSKWQGPKLPPRPSPHLLQRVPIRRGQSLISSCFQRRMCCCDIFVRTQQYIDTLKELCLAHWLNIKFYHPHFVKLDLTPESQACTTLSNPGTLCQWLMGVWRDRSLPWVLSWVAPWPATPKLPNPATTSKTLMYSLLLVLKITCNDCILSEQLFSHSNCTDILSHVFRRSPSVLMSMYRSHNLCVSKLQC